MGDGITNVCKMLFAVQGQRRTTQLSLYDQWVEVTAFIYDYSRVGVEKMGQIRLESLSIRLQPTLICGYRKVYRKIPTDTAQKRQTKALPLYALGYTR